MVVVQSVCISQLRFCICSPFTTYSVPKETEVQHPPQPPLCFINQDHNDNGDDADDAAHDADDGDEYDHDDFDDDDDDDTVL